MGNTYLLSEKTVGLYLFESNRGLKKKKSNQRLDIEVRLAEIANRAAPACFPCGVNESPSCFPVSQEVKMPKVPICIYLFIYKDGAMFQSFPVDVFLLRQLPVIVRRSQRCVIETLSRVFGA